MKSKSILILLTLTFAISFHPVLSQESKSFPIDPYLILKSWNYDGLIKAMGEGEEVLATTKNQTYLAGLKYPKDFLGMHGKLEFYFNKDSISRIQFRIDHETRVTSADLTGGKTKDPTVNSNNALAISRLDSLQKRDSISRDSVVRAISEIMGTPLSNGRTAITEKNARHSAIWINHGFSCLYKDYIDYSEIVFSLSTVPLWTVGEFDIPAGTQILRKSNITTRKLSWSAALLGFPANTPAMAYSNIYLLLEYTTGQRYVASIPDSPVSFLPELLFEDCDGDAIPEAWIQVPNDPSGNQMRHFVFSLKFKEPNMVFNSDELIPASVSILNGTKITVTFQDGSSRMTDAPKALGLEDKTFIPNGFRYLNTTKLNSDGSANFAGGIAIPSATNSQSPTLVEVLYKHTPGGWEPELVRIPVTAR